MWYVQGNQPGMAAGFLSLGHEAIRECSPNINKRYERITTAVDLSEASRSVPD